MEAVEALWTSANDYTTTRSMNMETGDITLRAQVVPQNLHHLFLTIEWTALKVDSMYLVPIDSEQKQIDTCSILSPQSRDYVLAQILSTINLRRIWSTFVPNQQRFRVHRALDQPLTSRHCIYTPQGAFRALCIQQKHDARCKTQESSMDETWPGMDHKWQGSWSSRHQHVVILALRIPQNFYATINLGITVPPILDGAVKHGDKCSSII